MPASLRRLKYSFGVPSVPTPSWIRLTCTPCRCLAMSASASLLADLVVVEDVGLHVDVSRAPPAIALNIAA